MEEDEMNTRKYEKAIAASIRVFAITFFTSIGRGSIFASLYGLVPAICTFALLIANKITPLRRAIYFIFTFIFWFGFDLIALNEGIPYPACGSKGLGHDHLALPSHNPHDLLRLDDLWSGGLCARL